jgi:hypothetical protein
MATAIGTFGLPHKDKHGMATNNNTALAFNPL